MMAVAECEVEGAAKRASFQNCACAIAAGLSFGGREPLERFHLNDHRARLSARIASTASSWAMLRFRSGSTE